jgi:hypothetical protein
VRKQIVHIAQDSMVCALPSRRTITGGPINPACEKHYVMTLRDDCGKNG